MEKELEKLIGNQLNQQEPVTLNTESQAKENINDAA